MTPPSPRPGVDGVLVPTRLPQTVPSGRPIVDAVALFSNRLASYAVSVPEHKGEDTVRIARIVPGGLHWSYRQLFDVERRPEDLGEFSATAAYTGVVVEFDPSSRAVIDSYLAPIKLRVFSGAGPRAAVADKDRRVKRSSRDEAVSSDKDRRVKRSSRDEAVSSDKDRRVYIPGETLHAPRSFWRSVARSIDTRSNPGEAKHALRDIVDTYAANLLGECGAAAPFLVANRFAPSYVSGASLPVIRDRFRRDAMPAVASRVAAIQFARVIEDQPPVERDGIVDLVEHLNERYAHGRSRHGSRRSA